MREFKSNSKNLLRGPHGKRTGSFREHFKGFEGAFVLIGGAACHEWFAAEGLEFRATKDLDMVLVIEVIDPAFVAALRKFVADGGYEILPPQAFP